MTSAAAADGSPAVVTCEADESQESMCEACAEQPASFCCCVGCSEGWVSEGCVSLKFGDPGAEKLSAELEQRAVSEADMLMAADGSICAERLALMSSTYDKTFVQRVLSRTPFAAQVELPAENWDAEALNTALLLEDFREIRQFQTAPPSTRNIFPNRLHSLYEGHLSFDPALLTPQAFVRAHPHIKPQAVRGGTLATLHEFRALLRTLSHGITEGLPLHPDRLVLGGGSMPWCLRHLTPAQRELCSAEAAATRLEAQLRARLARRFGNSVATMISWMAFGDETGAADRQARSSSKSHVPAAAIRQRLRKELHVETWDDADIDLFVINDDTDATIRETVEVLQRNIDAVTGFKGSVMLRTKNTLTIVGGWPLPNVQVVCKTVRSVQELLVHADIDCTALAYDGTRVWSAMRGLRALHTGFNFIPKQVLEGKGMRSDRSCARFGKYVKRGWGVLVFEHCRHSPRCDLVVAPGALQSLREKKSPKLPRVSGRPSEKGRALADWMLRISPQLLRKVVGGTNGDKDVGSNFVDANNILSHRHVPGDVDVRVKREASAATRDRPFRNYSRFTDLVIPRSQDVCSATLREYVQALGRPDLLQEATCLAAVAVAPKTASDRQQWQDRLRGKCYMCKVAVQTKELWPICHHCAAFNTSKREEAFDFQGKVAIVTGGRTKIGRECALRLLRAGGTVVITSRFPLCASERYAQEEDFESFRERLHILGADFKRMRSVQRVVDLVIERFDKIDVLVHNAAQTIRRPPAYYEGLIRKENELSSLTNETGEPSGGISPDASFVSKALALLPVDLPAAAVPLLSSDLEAEEMKAAWFPIGKTDAHGEQLDLRTKTSWTQTLEDTEMPELVEVLAVNLVVPYLLTARWLPLLKQSANAFVVFVTSQEGSFTTPTGVKNGTHPQTNVAKAGLNMLSKTIASDLRQSAVFVSAVDPGWVSWMKPGDVESIERAPLTEADGAARVLDPIISGMRAVHANRSPPVGVLYKDFRIYPW